MMLLSPVNYLILAIVIKRKRTKFCELYCKNRNIKVISTPFKVIDLLASKDLIQKSVMLIALLKQLTI